MLPDAIKNRPVTTTVGVLFAAASAFGGLAWKAFELLQKVQRLEREQAWMRRDLKEAGVTQFYWSEE